MRISDWSSDVCSSDLADQTPGHQPSQRPRHFVGGFVESRAAAHRQHPCDAPFIYTGFERDENRKNQHHNQAGERSEEHTSELQSLMRISYAVFCLKKKTKPTKTHFQQKNKNRK